MTEAKDHISLTTIVPKLPAEAQSWINGLTPDFRSSTEHVLNIVGEESFIKNWEYHRDTQKKVENDFAR